MSSSPFQLDWIDDFVDRIRPYVFVRLRDRVLIRMPNQAFKLNTTGSRILHHLLRGGSVRDILEKRSCDQNLPKQLNSFFTDLARTLNSTICDEYNSPSLERTHFELGYIELPILSEVAVTWRCNIKCKFCYASCRCISETEKDLSGDELSTDDFKRVLDIIRSDAEVPSVSFTGGEPVLREDLEELIAYAAGTLKMRVNLITNGTLITEVIAKRYKKAGLASAQVSIESPDSRVHDGIVGVKGAFASSLNGLLSLKKTGVAVHPHSTLCQLNIHSLPRLALFVKSLGIDRLSMNMIIPAGRGSAEDLAVKYTDVKDIILKMKSEAEAAGIRFMWYSPTPMCLFNPIPHQLGNKGCSACEGLLSVDPYGRILPCSSWKEPLGNILEEGFNALWFGERGRFVRNKQAAHPKCRECEHFAVCHGACPLYFQAHGYDELEPMLSKFKTGKSLEQRSCP
jgi:radical SAM protein with 4Fe4S-binding SPASM domain